MSFVDLPGQFLVGIRRFAMRPSSPKHWPWMATWLQATSLFVALSYEALKSDFARMFTEAQCLCIGDHRNHRGGYTLSIIIHHYPHIRCTAWRILKSKKSWRTAPSAWSWAFHAPCLPFCEHLQTLHKFKVGEGFVDTAALRRVRCSWSIRLASIHPRLCSIDDLLWRLVDQ